MGCVIFPDEILLNIYIFSVGYFSRQRLEKALGWPVTEFELILPKVNDICNPYNNNKYHYLEINLTISDKKYYKIIKYKYIGFVFTSLIKTV